MSAAPSQPAGHHIVQSALTYAAYVPAYNATDHITQLGLQSFQRKLWSQRGFLRISRSHSSFELV